MGLAVFIIYVPAFLIVSAIVISISVFTLRIASRSEAIVRNRQVKFLAGAVTAILLSSAYGWWFSKTANGLSVVVGPLAISLLGPPIIGTLTVIVQGLFFHDKHPSFLLVASGAFLSTLVMPILGIPICNSLDGTYNFLFQPMFTRLCTPSKIEFLEVVEPPKGLAVIHLLRQPHRYHQHDPEWLLLSDETPLQFVEKIYSYSKGGENNIVRITLKQNLEGQITGKRYEEIFSVVPIASLSSEYNVKFSELDVPSILGYGGETNGQRIEIERVSDGKIVAAAEGYWNDLQHSECPTGFGAGDFISNFVSKALNIPQLKDK